MKLITKEIKAKLASNKGDANVDKPYLKLFNPTGIGTWYLSELNPDTNVAYGLESHEINEGKVRDSLEAAQLKDLISSLPEGLRTKIGDNGIRLSGGQRQRIAIARAFYLDAKLLILDEATSALDNKTESELINALSQMKNKLTIIFIAHRLTTIKECDCIYEFENGKIKAKGKFNDLKEKSKSFAEMIKISEKY